MITPSPPTLCVADDDTFWAWHRWPDFSRWPEPSQTLVIVPFAGMADWGLGHSLDAEETVLMHLVQLASRLRPPHLRLLVLPPLRFVLGPTPACAFPLGVPAAHTLVNEVLASVKAAGFGRAVFCNSSPWNEEFLAAASRDNRVAQGLQLFRIHLSGLGLDFHPSRGRRRRELQTLLTALTGREPELPPEPLAETAVAETDDDGPRPLAGPAVPLSAARAAGEAILRAAAEQLLTLLLQISAWPPLAEAGARPLAPWPIP